MNAEDRAVKWCEVNCGLNKSSRSRNAFANMRDARAPQMSRYSAIAVSTADSLGRLGAGAL